MITREEFQKEVTAILKGALAGLPEAAQLEKVSEVLQTAEATVSDLMQKISAKDEELTQSGEENKALNQRVEELVVLTKQLEEQLAVREAELKDLDEKRASAETRAVAAEGVLAEAAAIHTLEARVAELAEAKVLMSGDKLEAQKAKIAVMTDEEYTSYRDERVEIRSELEAALKESATEEVVEAEEVVEVAPPEINKEEAAAAGALDVEIVEQKTLKAKYLELAQNITKLMGSKV